MTEEKYMEVSEQITEKLEQIKKLPIGSKERESLNKEIRDCYQILIENDKISNEYYAKLEQNQILEAQNKRQNELQEEKLKEEKKDKKWQRGLQIAGITICLGDLIQRGIAWKQTMHLEENGTLKTQTGRGLFGLFNRGNRPKM